MTSWRGRIAGRAAALLWLLWVGTPGLLPAAERLHLDSGGRIDVERFWISGNTLLYEAQGGTVGIPRSMVVRIERLREAREAPVPASTPGRPVAERSTTELRETQRQAHEALERRDYERAASHFLSLLKDQPDLYSARVGYAVSQIELEHDGLALSVVLDGISRDPERPELYILLGQLRYREDRLDDALRAWGRAFELAPTDELRDLLLKVERELHASRDYDFSASSHFNLHYDGALDPELAHAMLDYLEEQYWVVTETLRHDPPQPITVQLFPRREFRDVTQAPEWAGGLYDGKIRLPLGGLTRLTPDAKRVLVHELTHAVLHSKSRGSAPRWLHEGLAQMAEGKKLLRSELQAIVGELGAVSDDRWAEMEFSYPRALSLTQYLATRSGFDSLVDVVERIGRGAEIEQALRDVYGQGYSELCRAWGRELQQDRRR